MASKFEYQLMNIIKKKDKRIAELTERIQTNGGKKRNYQSLSYSNAKRIRIKESTQINLL